MHPQSTQDSKLSTASAKLQANEKSSEKNDQQGLPEKTGIEKEPALSVPPINSKDKADKMEGNV